MFVVLILQNPEYMKENFEISIETMHVDNDDGTQDNVSTTQNLSYLCLILVLSLLGGNVEDC